MPIESVMLSSHLILCHPLHPHQKCKHSNFSTFLLTLVISVIVIVLIVVFLLGVGTCCFKGTMGHPGGNMYPGKQLDFD